LAEVSVVTGQAEEDRFVVCAGEIFLQGPSKRIGPKFCSGTAIGWRVRTRCDFRKLAG
jgi:hypothetical protein